MEIKLENTGVTIGAATNPSITITLNEIVLEEMEYSYNTGELTRYQFTAQAHYSLTDAKSIQIDLVNTQASY